MEGGDGRKPPKDYYKVLEVDYDATEEDIRLSYRRLALKWHPDKHKGKNDVTARFQEINEAYGVLSDPDKRLDYDLSGSYEIDRYTLRVIILHIFGYFDQGQCIFNMEVFDSGISVMHGQLSLNLSSIQPQEYLTRFKGMILTCNGLGINPSPKWKQHERLNP